MAKSKLVTANKKIEEGVVKGYQGIEKTFVNGFNKMTDKFVDTYLTKDKESVKDAKLRLIAEQKERGEKSAMEMKERKTGIVSSNK